MRHMLTRERFAAALPLVVPLLFIVDLLLLPFGVLPALRGVDGSGDFQWSGAHLLAHGLDPYRVLLDGDPGFIRTQFPNYLHGLYVLLLPLGVLPFPVARVVWGILNVAMVGTSAVLLGRGIGLRGWSLAGLVALLGCSVPFLIAMHAGQQSALVLFFSVVGYRARNQVVQGAFLAIAVTKYSFGPLGFLLLCRRRWSAIGVAVAIATGAVVTIGVWTGSPLVALAVEPFRVSRGMAQGAADAMSFSGILTQDPRSPATYVAALVTALVLLLLGRRVLSAGHWVDALACAALISLMSFPHLVYDFCLLLPVLTSALRLRGRGQVVLLLVVGYFWYNWLIGGFLFGPFSTWGVTTNFALLAVAFTVLVRSVAVPSTSPDLVQDATVGTVAAAG